MQDRNKRTSTHLKIAIITFFISLPILFFLAKISLPYGKNKVTLGSLLVLVYGCYLVYAISLYFKKNMLLWKNNFPWKNELGKNYLRLSLFCLFITLLILSNYASGIIWHGTETPSLSWMFSLKSALSGVITFFLPYFFFVGLSIVFPLSLYTLFLSIKSLIYAKTEGRSSRFGITLLVTSLILLALSLPAIMTIIQFWLTGGTTVAGRF